MYIYILVYIWITAIKFFEYIHVEVLIIVKIRNFLIAKNILVY